MKWRKKYTPPEQLNGGNEYFEDSDVSLETFNTANNNAFYAVSLAKNTPNAENANVVGVPSVEIETMADGTPRLKFSNLKGQQGEQGERGEQGVQGERSNICMSYDTYVRGKTYNKVDTNPRAKRNDIVIFQNKYVATVGWESGNIFTVVDDTAISIQGATGEKGDVNLTQLNDSCLVPSDNFTYSAFNQPTTTEKTFTAEHNGHLIMCITASRYNYDVFQWKYSNSPDWFEQILPEESGRGVSTITVIIPMRKGQTVLYQMKFHDAERGSYEFRLSEEVK